LFHAGQELLLFPFEVNQDRPAGLDGAFLLAEASQPGLGQARFVRFVPIRFNL
jgi:hypothetical protein